MREQEPIPKMKFFETGEGAALLELIRIQYEEFKRLFPKTEGLSQVEQARLREVKDRMGKEFRERQAALLLDHPEVHEHVDTEIIEWVRSLQGSVVSRGAEAMIRGPRIVVPKPKKSAAPPKKAVNF